MKLSEFLTQIDDKDKKRSEKSLVAVVYENYRVIGLTSEIKAAVGNRKDSTGEDLLNEEIDQQYLAAAYGNVPPTYLVYIEKEAAAVPQPLPSGDDGTHNEESPSQDS